MTEEEQVRRAKRQLTVVGAVCVSLIVFVLWITQLKNNLASLNQKLPSLPQSAFKETEAQLGPQWQAFKKQLQNLHP